MTSQIIRYIRPTIRQLLRKTLHKYFSDNYPDHALLFAWNHATEILAKEQKFLDNGGEQIIFCD